MAMFNSKLLVYQRVRPQTTGGKLSHAKIRGANAWDEKIGGCN